MTRISIIVAIFHFLTNLLLILATNRLCRCHSQKRELFLAAMVGSVQAALCTYTGFSFLGKDYWRVTFLLLTAGIAFGSGKMPLRQAAMYIVLYLAMGEIAQGRILAFLLAVAAIGLLCAFSQEHDQMMQKTVPVTIRHGNKKLSLTALVDTGNTLRDPVTGCRILVVDGSVAESLLGFDMEALEDPLRTMSCHFIPGLRLIPYSTVGQPNGFMLGFRPQQLFIKGRASDHILGFSPNRIGQQHSFQALTGGLF